jgi:4-methyl-5(b-hydroxyethyl)-thiazole monophosphate biosynthesis
MKQIIVFLANGFEEMEALIPVDVWRRAGFDVKMVTINSQLEVTGAHQIKVVADQLFEESDFSSADLLFLPGGMPGASNLDAHDGLKALLTAFNSKGKILGAICAAPMVLGHNGLLEGKKATCFPSFEKDLVGANHTGKTVEVDGNIITARGAGVAFEFSLKVVELLSGKEVAKKLAAQMQVADSFMF